MCAKTGSPTSGDAQGDGAAVVVGARESLAQGQGRQMEEWLGQGWRGREMRKPSPIPLTEHSEVGEPDALKGARPVCAVRRCEVSLSQTGRTKEKFLSYQLTQRRKPNGTTACWANGACPSARKKSIRDRTPAPLLDETQPTQHQQRRRDCDGTHERH